MVLTIDDCEVQIEQWREERNKLVFTNGCFDILHLGHIDYLQKAKKLGDKLIVGINSDASVRTLNKGINRPIQDQNSRLKIIAALSCVDAVILFEESTPLRLIKKIMPSVLVKGGDYIIEDIVGFSEIKTNGGRVVALSFLVGYSTSAIEQKIKTGF